ncbi:MAG: IPT/TIG domain-containing protein [Planctomycetota bacterium]|jgi:hypothetical protein
MKNHIKTIFAASGLALVVGAVGVLSLPSTTAAYSLIGGSLGVGQRDFRVFNNFTDAAANNNTTPHVNFPGQTGAIMAIWKGHVEWGSSLWAGNGLGDPSAGNLLGDGGANFDNKFEGETNIVGSTNDNIHSELAGSQGSTLAYTELPISNGWRIRYLSTWLWADGPGGVGSAVDLQGVACHEIGHSLGLGHTSTSGATMFPSITGTGIAQRSIATDDINGVKAIYGVKSGSKATITSLSGSKQIGGILEINGTNFASSGNTVRFTDADADGTPETVTGVSSSGGGTLITVTIPSGVADGDVQVWNGLTGHSSLSNSFPIDIGAPAGNPPNITSIDPATGPEGGWTEVTITGTGFTGSHTVQFGGTDAVSFVVDSNTQITAVTPPGAVFTQASVFVQDVEGSDTLPSAFFYTLNPLPNISTVTPDEGTLAGGTSVLISGSSVVGVTSVTFGGAAGTNLEVLSATQVSVDSPAGSEGFVDVVAQNSAGSSTITNGFEYTDPGQFIDIGPGVGSVLGAPVLSGTGSLAVGSPTGFSIVLSNALSNQLGTLFVSLSQGAVPFKGGTFYPIPILIQFPIIVDGFGGFVLSSTIPAGTPSGTAFVLQTWNNDFLAPFGLAGSNGLKAIVP